ncbi:MAG: sodium:solute symporter family protein [Aestuariibacter sp.]|nr:sodium:solute symporter family protein [Aestuariibacter sp.]
MTDLLVFGGYLIIVLLIGKFTGKRIHSADDFHLCGRNLGRLPAALSQAATEFSGSGLIGGAGLAYAIGLSAIWWNWAAAPVYIVVGFTVVYLLRKMKVGTTPGFLGRCYGTRSQRLAATLQVIGLVMFTGVQIKASMVTLSALFGMDPIVAAVLVSTVFIAYTMMGGLWAVVWTDVLQYSILMGGVILAAVLAYFYVGGIPNLVNNLPESHLDATSIGGMGILGYFLLVMHSYSTDQMALQRGLAAKDPKVARFAFVYTGLNYLVFGACVAFLGMCAAVLLPELANPDDALPKLISEIFPSGLRGLMLTAILAVTMSTASSALAAASAMLVQDLYEPLVNSSAKKTNSSVVRDSRVATFAVGITALFLAVAFPGVIEMVFFGVAVANAPLFFPMILGLYGRKINHTAAFLAIILTAVFNICSHLFWYGKVSGILGEVHYYILGPLLGLAIMLIGTLVWPVQESRVNNYADDDK